MGAACRGAVLVLFAEDPAFLCLFTYSSSHPRSLPSRGSPCLLLVAQPCGSVPNPPWPARDDLPPPSSRPAARASATTTRRTTSRSTISPPAAAQAGTGPSVTSAKVCRPRPVTRFRTFESDRHTVSGVVASPSVQTRRHLFRFLLTQCAFNALPRPSNRRLGVRPAGDQRHHLPGHGMHL